MRQLEREIKLNVSPGWSLPDLAGVLPEVEVVELPALSMEATYYDTADFRLARRHVTLRLRSETGGERTERIWTVKLPAASEGAVLARTELTWPAEPLPPSSRRAAGTAKATSQRGQRSGTAQGPAPREVHPEAGAFVRALATGLPLVPIARLSTTRRRIELRNPDGCALAEVDHDSVVGTRLLDPYDGVLAGNITHQDKAGSSPDSSAPDSSAPGSSPTEVRFDEVEVELAEDGDLEVLGAVAARLRAGGARRSFAVSKLGRVLGLVPGTRWPRAVKVGPASPMAALLRSQLAACLDGLLDHDPAVRTGDPDPEHVHRARVAARRLRSVLLAFRSQFDDLSLVELRQELRWLGECLGRARDADVRARLLEAECAVLPPADSLGTALLVDIATADRDHAHEQLLEALASDRYIALLRALASGSEAPLPLDGPALTPAARAVPPLVRLQWRSLRRAVAHLDCEPTDEALHQVRIKAKHLRYASEAAAPVVAPTSSRKAALRTVKAATALQDVLGQLHDAVVQEAWLRSAAGATTTGASPVPGTTGPVAGTALRGARKTAVALVAGQLVTTAREERLAQRAAWPAAWARLDHKQLRRWTEP
jgi:CHAD domain-containing protein